MFNYIKIFIYLLYLINKCSGVRDDTILINDVSHRSQNYKIIYPVERMKREPLPWFYPEIDKNQISCGHNVYAKLYTCSQLTECRNISSCLEPVHCPLNIKSFGGLIINLLHLLGLNNCNTNEQLCPNSKRLIILKNLFTYWSKTNDDIYCKTITNFIEKVKFEIENQCPLHLRQVEAFLENYACSNTTTKNPLETTTTQISYIDEDNDLKFINVNKVLFNNTDLNVYINDHHYYNVSYIIPKFEDKPMYYVQDNNQFTRIHALSNRHRSAFGIKLKFSFPYYGHMKNKIFIATGGFIYTGDLLHSELIGSAQYIAPFMANFDTSIGSETGIKYYDNGTHFICTWSKIHLQDQREVGPFTFQTILENTGNIYFNYIKIPTMNISGLYHAHRIGISDAYVTQHSTNEHIVRVVTLYDKINLDKDKIKNGVSIIFNMEQTCNTFTDCSSCLANRGKRFNCSWCEDIQKCSDGYDRSREQWIRAQCHHLASEQTCPNSLEDIYDNNHIFSTLLTPRMSHEKRKQLSPSSSSSSRSSSAFQTFRTIVITLLLSVVILSILTLTITYIYGYRNPTSPIGMWLLEHRPSTYITHFKRFIGL